MTDVTNLSKEFYCFVVRQVKGIFVGGVEKKKLSELPNDDVLVKVHYSTLNYKDALSISGDRGVTKKFPHIPGIDAVGIVEYSKSSSFVTGSKVIVSGFDMGMNHPGGFSEYVCVPHEWLTTLPEGLTMVQSMMFGTAGFTAARAVDMLIQQGVQPQDGEILVTGATGGLGSIAIAILSQIGFSVVALSGKDNGEYLKSLGATRVVKRELFDIMIHKKLLQENWAGIIDTAGGKILESCIKQVKYGGVAISCGNALSGDLNISVYPFIIRGIRLIGIDSARLESEKRLRIWNLLAGDWKIIQLEQLSRMITLDELAMAAKKMLQAKMIGRTVIKICEDINVH